MYGFEDKGEAQTDTGLGKLATHCYIRHREGSSRTTYLWVAPQLDYLPARIETRKDDEVQTALTMMSLAGIEKRSPLSRHASPRHVRSGLRQRHAALALVLPAAILVA